MKCLRVTLSSITYNMVKQGNLTSLSWTPDWLTSLNTGDFGMRLVTVGSSALYERECSNRLLRCGFSL